MKTKKRWKKIADSKVRHLWTPSQYCRCSMTVADVDVSPDYYAANGTPICPGCGEDMEYVRTEVYQ